MDNADREISGIYVDGDPHYRVYLPLIGVLALAYYLSYLRYGLIQFDEGELIETAERLLMGQEYCADVLIHYGIFKAWMLSGFFALAGVSFLAERIFFVLLRIPVLMLMYAVAVRILPRKWALGAVLVSILAPGHLFKSTFLLLILLQVWLAYKWWETSNALYSAAMAAWGTFAIWQRVESWLPLVAAGIGVLMYGFSTNEELRAQWRRHVFFFLAGLPVGVAILLPIMPYGYRYFLWSFRAAVFILSTGSAEIAVPWPRLSFLAGNADRVATFLAMNTAALVYIASMTELGARVLRGSRDDRTFYRVVLTGVGVAMFYNVISQSNMSHLLQVGGPVFIIFADIFRRSLSALEGKWKRAALATVLGAIALAFTVYFAFLTDRPDLGSFAVRNRADTPIRSLLGTVYFLDPPASQIQDVVDYIVENTGPDDYVFGFSLSNIIPVLARRQYPTLLTFYTPYIHEALGERLAQGMRRDLLKCKYIVYYERTTILEAKRSPISRAVNNPVGFYKVMERNFHVETIIHGYVIMRKGKDPTGATPVFLEGWEAYKYEKYEKAREKFAKALKLGGPEHIIKPLLDEAARRSERRGGEP